MERGFWHNKRVMVTGHTGFKGGWLSLWLYKLGANVHGYSLEPNVDCEFYNRVYSGGFIGTEQFSDIRDIISISQCVDRYQPEVIFHLAAQPLVRHSYAYPFETYAVNIMGVVNLLEAVRQSSYTPTIINVTTDKVYENKEWIWAYRENESLGGADPYSASKACSEILTNSYMQSFFKGSGTKVATARAGNVIGGGDMSQDRLIPDFLRAFERDEPVVLRNPNATRPWQHVLEPVSGYLRLAEMLSSEPGLDYATSWNFGPIDDPLPVGRVVDMLSNISGGKKYLLDENLNPHEAQSLMLDSAKARRSLNWRPKLDLNQALTMTFDWYQSAMSENDMMSFTSNQILNYINHDKID